MNSYPMTMAEDYGLVDVPPLPPSIVGFMSSVKRKGRFSVPPELHLTAAFAELKLDLRDALFPSKHVLIVANSLCASVTVLLPVGATVEDRTVAIAASHQLSQESDELGPVIHVEGWSVFSDVKFLAER
ncbi:MAG TPA: hypothetical protein VFS62_14665 [Chloroflexota bacterium]|nr:hypothetical protein [Chloroflexota bacterium]